MFFLALRSYGALLGLEFYLASGNFAKLYDAVRRRPRRECEYEDSTIEQVCSGVDHACVWYWKKVLCLQRSAVTVRLLRDHGIPAELVIGVQHLPFRAHAWVEVAGRVVNDRSYTSDMYAVLDRC
jgi:transglutaminase superfamily protein